MSSPIDLAAIQRELEAAGLMVFRDRTRDGKPLLLCMGIAVIGGDLDGTTYLSNRRVATAAEIISRHITGRVPLPARDVASG